MSDKVFLDIVNMSITGSFAILIIMLARLLLKKAPKVFSYALWFVAFFRLLVPVSFRQSCVCDSEEICLMQKEKFILCPICGNKTRVQIREDTELKNFPLFCPKCHKQTLINAKQLNITKAEVPDAKTQSR